MKKELEEISNTILNIDINHPLRVGINGIDGSGKTTFAAALADELRTKTQRQVVTFSIDGFHNPRSIRYQKGRDSAEGFYKDSFQFETFQSVLKTLKTPNGTAIPLRVFDVRTDQAANEALTNVTADAIVLIEGILIFVPLLAPHFDFKIYLDVPFDVALQRMLKRDADLFETEEEEIKLFESRYKPGQQLYMNEVDPKKISDVVIPHSPEE